MLGLLQYSPQPSVQLGMNLKPKRIPVHFLMIDHIEKLSEN
jgi:hypothetical protein